MKNATPLLSARQLSIGYDAHPIVSQINLSFYSGELTAIIGINGSGKTTLLKTLSGELKPVSGAVFLKEKPVTAYSGNDRAQNISIVLTNPSFSANLRVKEVIALGRYPFSNWLGLLTPKDREVINTILQQLEIRNLAQKKCGTLSDGQLQKIFIARALAQDTELILFDEPDNHLDLFHRAFIFKNLKSLTRSHHKAIILVTHDLNAALRICDRIVLINQGKAIQDTPDNLIKSGALQSLFDKDFVFFDKGSGTFLLNG